MTSRASPRTSLGQSKEGKHVAEDEEYGPANGFHCLPEDLWIKIFKLISTDQLATGIMPVCKNWKEWGRLASYEICNLKGGTFSKVGLTTENKEALYKSIIDRQLDLRVLIVHLLEINTIQFQFLFGQIHLCTKLYVVDITRSKRKDGRHRDFICVRDLPDTLRIVRTNMPLVIDKDVVARLTNLVFFEASIFQTDWPSTLPHVGNYNHLQAIRMHEAWPQDMDTELSLMPELRYMDIRADTPLNHSNRLLESLLRFENLQYLRMTQIKALWRGISLLRSHPTLKKVCVECQTCSNIALQSLLSLPQLFSLTITALEASGDYQFGFASPTNCQHLKLKAKQSLKFQLADIVHGSPSLQTLEVSSDEFLHLLVPSADSIHCKSYPNFTSRCHTCRIDLESLKGFPAEHTLSLQAFGFEATDSRLTEIESTEKDQLAEKPPPQTTSQEKGIYSAAPVLKGEKISEEKTNDEMQIAVSSDDAPSNNSTEQAKNSQEEKPDEIMTDAKLEDQSLTGPSNLEQNLTNASQNPAVTSAQNTRSSPSKTNPGDVIKTYRWTQTRFLKEYKATTSRDSISELDLSPVLRSILSLQDSDSPQESYETYIQGISQSY